MQRCKQCGWPGAVEELCACCIALLESLARTQQSGEYWAEIQADWMQSQQMKRQMIRGEVN